MKSKKICLVVVFFIVLITAHAQELRRDSTKREKGTTEVIVFTRDGGSNATPKPNEDGPNVVKAGLTDWVSGYIPFYYERRVLPWLSVQVGAGITTRDFVADVVNDILANDYADYSRRKSSVGPFVSLQPKFYVHSDALDGFFVSPMVAFKQWNYKANLVDPTITVNDDEPVYEPGVYQREYRNAVDFTVNLGWQWLFHPVTLEYTMGGGFRRFWESRLGDPVANTNNIGGTYYTNGPTINYSGFRPDFNLSLNLGGFF